MFARPFASFLVLLSAVSAVPAAAQNSEVPYWASLASEEVYMRVGPSPSYPIDWVYTREGLPVKVIRVNQGWRLVEDPDGVRGWMSASLLTRARGAIVVGEGVAAMRAKGESGARVRWNVEPGVVGDLGSCSAGWCEFVVAGHKGFVEQARLWGAGEP